MWIDFQRDPNSEAGKELDRLLAAGEVVMVGPVLTEILQGSRSVNELEFFATRLTALSFLEATQETWVNAGQLNHLLRREGKLMALSDLVIATLALEHDMALYSLDGDFDRVPGLQHHRPSQSE